MLQGLCLKNALDWHTQCEGVIQQTITLTGYHLSFDRVVDKDATPGTSQTLMEQAEFLNYDIQYTLQVLDTIGKDSVGWERLKAKGEAGGRQSDG